MTTAVNSVFELEAWVSSTQPETSAACDSYEEFSITYQEVDWDTFDNPLVGFLSSCDLKLIK